MMTDGVEAAGQSRFAQKVITLGIFNVRPSDRYTIIKIRAWRQYPKRLRQWMLVFLVSFMEPFSCCFS